jgi:hypothetical protein
LSERETKHKEIKMSKQERIQEATELMQDAPTTKRVAKAKAFFDYSPSIAALRTLKAAIEQSAAIRERTESQHDDDHSAEYAPLNCRKCAAQGWN